MEIIKRNFIKNISIFFTILAVTFWTVACSFAGEVPKYDFKNPNPKPGLYRLDDMKYKKSSPIVTTFLNDNEILVMGEYTGRSTKEHPRSAEILNLKTGKFETLPDPNYFPQKILPTDDGRFLIFGSTTSSGVNVCFEIYNPKTKTFTDTKICKKDKWSYKFRASLYKLSNNKFALYMREYEMPYTYKSKREFLMYIYDANTNILSETPLREGDKGYIDYIKITEPDTASIKEYNSLSAVIRKETELKRFYHVRINDDEVIIFARDMVDYGISLDSAVLNGDYKSWRTWFSPIYKYNFKSKQLIPVNEYVRSSFVFPFKVKFNDRNAFLFLGGYIHPHCKDPNTDPKNIPYRQRVDHFNSSNITKSTYVYIYE